jgi:hypothetical protein
MQVLTSGVSVFAQAFPVRTPGVSKPTSFELHVTVNVEDSDIRRELPGFDGLERLSVRVPDASGAWNASELRYAGRVSYGRGASIEHHIGVIPGIDLNSAFTQGVALFMQTNVGEVALQKFGNNHAVTVWPPNS